MAEEDHQIYRSFEAANRVQQMGLLKGFGLGSLLALPFAIPLGIIGAWLDASKGDSEWVGGLLAVCVIEAGGFAGAFWMAQTAAMRNWPAEYRRLVSRAWRRSVPIAFLFSLPVATWLGWLAWRGE